MFALDHFRGDKKKLTAIVGSKVDFQVQPWGLLDGFFGRFNKAFLRETNG